MPRRGVHLENYGSVIKMHKSAICCAILASVLVFTQITLQLSAKNSIHLLHQELRLLEIRLEAVENAITHMSSD